MRRGDGREDNRARGERRSDWRLGSKRNRPQYIIRKRMRDKDCMLFKIMLSGKQAGKDKK